MCLVSFCYKTKITRVASIKWTHLVPIFYISLKTFTFMFAFKCLSVFWFKQGRVLVAMVTATSCFQSNVSSASMFSYRPTFIPRPLFRCLESRRSFGVTPDRGELVGGARLGLSLSLVGGRGGGGRGLTDPLEVATRFAHLGSIYTNHHVILSPATCSVSCQWLMVSSFSSEARTSPRRRTCTATFSTLRQQEADWEIKLLKGKGIWDCDHFWRVLGWNITDESRFLIKYGWVVVCLFFKRVFPD